MDRRSLLQCLPAIALIPAAVWAGSEPEQARAAPSATAVYELRVYHANEGKLDDLLKRFREHTMGLFEKHGMKNVAYWTPLDDPLKGKTLIYVLAHPSREAAASNWQAFRDDPGWQKVRDASEVNGKLVDKVDSTFMTLTDFSPAL
jgi:NIPSNAP